MLMRACSKLLPNLQRKKKKYQEEYPLACSIMFLLRHLTSTNPAMALSYPRLLSGGSVKRETVAPSPVCFGPHSRHIYIHPTAVPP